MVRVFFLISILVSFRVAGEQKNNRYTDYINDPGISLSQLFIDTPSIIKYPQPKDGLFKSTLVLPNRSALIRDTSLSNALYTILQKMDTSKSASLPEPDQIKIHYVGDISLRTGITTRLFYLDISNKTNNDEHIVLLGVNIKEYEVRSVILLVKRLSFGGGFGSAVAYTKYKKSTFKVTHATPPKIILQFSNLTMNKDGRVD